MKTYMINPGLASLGDEPTADGLFEFTEQDILDEYWNRWQTQMTEKYGPGHELITKENCISDWVVVHWAMEKK